MKKMTKAILCLISVWGASWAQTSEYIDAKYSDLENEFATDSVLQARIENTAAYQNSEERSVTADSSVQNVPEQTAEQTAEVSEEQASENVAESAEAANVAVADSVNTDDADQVDEKEEITAAEAETNLANATADSSTEETLDFSTWINPACRPVHTTSPYKIRNGRLHRGVDVKVAIGDSIVAAAPGKVIVSKYNKGGYGHYIILKHANGTQTVYGHLSKRLMQVGDYAEQGQLIGLGGNTGRSTGSHLHFEIRYGEVNIDPSTVINFDEGKLVEGVDKYSVADATVSHKEIQKELSKHRVHKIRPGDTLGKLALKYGTTIDRICKLNKINRNSILKIGKLLQIS